MQRRDALMTMAALALGGCAGGSGAGSGKRQIAVIPKGTSHDFWKSVHFGADQAGREAGAEIIWLGTDNETDKEGQIKIVDNLISRQVAGICLAPIDRDAFVPVVKRARRQGVPMVIYDSGVSDESEIVSYVATNNRKGGTLAGEHLAQLLGGAGGVILLRYQAGSESTEEREQGFLEAIDEHEDIRVLSESQRVNSDAGEALKIASGLLNRFGDALNGVFTVCEPNNKGMLMALTQAKRPDGRPMAGEVKFVAFDSGPEIIRGLQDGVVHGVILQDPVNMGYLAVKSMVDHLDGKQVPRRVETGEYLATPENMNEPRSQELLRPRQYGADAGSGVQA
ncbi:MAG TPA: substrate-binding domain-containing protein [Planctomycetaceae bacterium]|nr:substrate-binding domain-containing protein [Planctomycetaceae bacterium]